MTSETRPYNLRHNLRHLSVKQERAVAALLTSETVEKAAESAGISRPTLHRWMNEPPFAEALRRARRQIVAAAVARLQKAAVRAVDTLCEIMDDSCAQAGPRVSAAKAVLDATFKVAELQDLQERVDALEAALERRDAS